MLHNIVAKAESIYEKLLATAEQRMLKDKYKVANFEDQVHMLFHLSIMEVRCIGRHRSRGEGQTTWGNTVDFQRGGSRDKTVRTSFTQEEVCAAPGTPSV
jgi:hypothetical protein